MTETWKKLLDGKGYGGGIFVDLPKAFDTTNFNLTAKLHGHGFTDK